MKTMLEPKCQEENFKLIVEKVIYSAESSLRVYYRDKLRKSLPYETVSAEEGQWLAKLTNKDVLKSICKDYVL